MAKWKADCSSDSECENLYAAIGEQFKSQDLVQVLSGIRDGGSRLECMKNAKRKKLSKKVDAVGEPSLKQEHDMEASDTTPTDLRSPLSTGGRDLHHAHQHQRHNLSAFDYDDDFPALIGKHKRSPVIKRKRKVVAQLDQVMSNYARHKRLDEQQLKFSKWEPAQQRLREPVQPVLTATKQSTVPQADLSFDSDSDDDDDGDPLDSHGLIKNSLQSQIQKVGKLLENDGLT